MLRNTLWAVLPAVLVAGLLCAPSASARDIKDEAELIKKPENLAKINQVIKEIKKSYGKEVFIETTSTVPTADANRVKAMVEAKDRDGLKTYFFELSRNRAKVNTVDGVYVLVNKSPRWLQILTNKKTEPYFDLNQVKEMRSIMETQFKKGNYDEGFLEGVTFIRDQFAKNPPKTAVAPAVRPQGNKPAAETGGVFKDKEGNWNWTGIICVGLVVLVVIWLIFGLIRAMSGAGGGGYGGAPGYAGGGGGGFMTGLLGGLFGAMAGNWLYHNMFGGGGSQAYGGSDPGASPGSSGDDYTGSGGGVDDAGGGGGDDAGGGDWGGGGDVGGGDWGGGGGDWGGGGGDFGGGGFGGGDF